MSSNLFQQIRLQLVLILCQIAFSTVNIFGTIALESLEPIPLVALRHLCSAPVALIVAFLYEPESLIESVKNWRKTFVRVGLGVGVIQAIMMWLYLYALKLSNPVNCGTLYLATIPVTALLGMILNYEKRMILKVVGVAFSLAGALVMLDLEHFQITSDTIIGDLLALSMVSFYSFYLVFTKKLADGMRPFTVSFWMFLYAGLVSALPIPFIYLFEDIVAVTSFHHFSITTWVSILIVCFVGTTLTYLLTNWALENTSSLVVAVYSPLELICTVLGGLFVLEIEFVWQQGVGAGLIVVGLLVVLYAKYKEKKEMGKVDGMVDGKVDDVDIEVAEKEKKRLLE